MSKSLIVRRDINFYIYDWLGTRLRSDRDSIDAFMDLSEKLAENYFLNHYKRSDIEEPTLTSMGVQISAGTREALLEYAEAGLFSSSFEEKFGGLAFSCLACSASFSYFAAANVATSAYPMLTVANARLITTFGNTEQIKTFAKPEIEGRWFGTMCLSEPQAGSSLADIRTRAEFDSEDRFGCRYVITGNKMWISGGDQDVSENIVHLVLAKIPEADGKVAEGTGKLSLFIVPKILPDGERNDIVVAGLNHKMGYRGTANCVLNFGEKTGAIGWLVGTPNNGLRQMFSMMNEARINVGIGAAALGYRGYRLSLQYAQERVQGRPIESNEISPVAIIEHADVRHMLLAQKAYVEGALALCLYSAHLVDQRDDVKSAKLLGLLTPVTKTWSSEYGLRANDLAIQIHGGYGYTRDYDVEQLWRDNRLNPIHEGTTGIQAIDLLKRKILKDQSAIDILKDEVSKTAALASNFESLVSYGCDLLDSWRQVESAIERLRNVGGARSLDNATLFLRAFGHAVVGWLWLDQAVVAARLVGTNVADNLFIEGKLSACRFYFESELPKVATWLNTVSLCSDVAMRIPNESF